MGSALCPVLYLPFLFSATVTALFLVSQGLCICCFFCQNSAPLSSAGRHLLPSILITRLASLCVSFTPCSLLWVCLLLYSLFLCFYFDESVFSPALERQHCNFWSTLRCHFPSTMLGGKYLENISSPGSNRIPVAAAGRGGERQLCS